MEQSLDQILEIARQIESQVHDWTKDENLDVPPSDTEAPPKLSAPDEPATRSISPNAKPRAAFPVLETNAGNPPAAPTSLPESSIRPFRRLRHIHSLFGQNNSLGDFCPTLEEYSQRQVHQPSITDAVEKNLLKKRFACVQGAGAAGKTTLAILIALGRHFAERESFYLDLADSGDNPDLQDQSLRALSSIGSHYANATLVVVDNIHLGEEVARELYDLQAQHERPVHLLMLGRKLQIRSDLRGRSTPLASIVGEARTLTVEGADLLGVYFRLARRAEQRKKPPTPPPAVLRAWQSVFSGDLFAFSHALKRKLELKRPGWELSEQDARDYVR
ncbi:MAG: ATP-binding protein, partial [Verrucomicrobia bacterium]|nr:ATP-binding protein [Verrucomicrobiota bacterium]